MVFGRPSRVRQRRFNFPGQGIAAQEGGIFRLLPSLWCEASKLQRHDKAPAGSRAALSTSPPVGVLWRRLGFLGERPDGPAMRELITSGKGKQSHAPQSP